MADHWLQKTGSVAAIASAVGVWLLLAAIGANTYSGWRSVASSTNTDAVVRLRGSVLGQKGAAVAVVEFSDFQCQACAAYARRVFPEVRKLYVDTGRVVYAQKHLILERRHPMSRTAAVAAECAARQSAMWAYRDRVFAASPSLDRTTLIELAGPLVADARSFEECVTAADGRAIEADLADAGRLRITATPTFVIGPVDDAGVIRIERTVVGASRTDLVQAIDEVLERVASVRRAP